MMKNIVKPFIILGIGLLMLSSCENLNEPALFEDDMKFVAFRSASYNVNEGQEILSIPVGLAAGKHSSPITVDYSVTLDTKYIDYTIVSESGKLTFAANEYTDTIKISWDDNFVSQGNDTLILTIQSAEYTGKAVNGSCRIVFVENDCPFDINNFVGTAWAGTEDYKRISGVSVEISTELGQAENTLVIDGLYVGMLSLWGETITDGGTMTLVLDNSDPANPTISSVPAQFFYCVTDAGYGYWVDGVTGTFSTCSNSMEIHYKVYWDDTYTNPDEADVVCNITLGGKKSKVISTSYTMTNPRSK